MKFYLPAARTSVLHLSGALVLALAVFLGFNQWISPGGSLPFSKKERPSLQPGMGKSPYRKLREELSLARLHPAPPPVGDLPAAEAPVPSAPLRDAEGEIVVPGEPVFGR